MAKDNENNNFNQVSINQVTLEIRTYSKVREIASQFKHIIECYVTKVIPDGGVSILSEDDLIQYFGETMDISKNRKLVFKVRGMSETFVTIMRDDRVELFKKCMKAYNLELYKGL